MIEGNAVGEVVAVERAEVLGDAGGHNDLLVLHLVAEALGNNGLLAAADQDVHCLEEGSRLGAPDVVEKSLLQLGDWVLEQLEEELAGPGLPQVHQLCDHPILIWLLWIVALLILFN